MNDTKKKAYKSRKTPARKNNSSREPRSRKKDPRNHKSRENVKKVVTRQTPNFSSYFSNQQLTKLPAQITNGGGAVKEIIVNNFVLENEDNDTDLIDGLIENAIARLEAQRGYTSALTVGDVTNYLENASKALDALFVIYVSQQVANVTDYKGKVVKSLFVNIPSTGYGASKLDSLDTITATVLNYGDDSISNAVWARSYLSKLPLIRVAPGRFNLSKHFYGSIFLNPAVPNGANFIRFWPNNIVGTVTTTDPLTAFASAISSLETALNSDRDLSIILDYIGVTNELAISEDWRRDLTGDSLESVLVHDPNLYTMFKSSVIYSTEINDSLIENQVEQIVWFPRQNSFKDHMLEAEVSKEHMFYGTYFTLIGLTANSFESDGGFVYNKLVQPGILEFDSLVLTTTGEERLQNIIQLFEVFRKSMVVESVHTITYTLADVNAASVTAQVLNGYVYEAMNVYDVYTEAEHFHEIMTAELIIGVNYREPLQLKLAGTYTAK